MSDNEEQPKDKSTLIGNSQGNQSKSEVIQQAKEILQDAKKK